MTTELKKFTQAYATMTVALYEPLIIQWYSELGIWVIANTMAHRQAIPRPPEIKRATVSQLLDIDKGRPLTRFESSLPEHIQIDGYPQIHTAMDVTGKVLSSDVVRPIKIPDYPNAIVIGNTVYPFGVLRVQPTASSGIQLPGNPNIGIRAIPLFVNGQVGAVSSDVNIPAARKAIFDDLINALEAHINDPTDSLETSFHLALSKVAYMKAAAPHKPAEPYHFLPVGRSLQEGLSPIGIAHFYRQLYFNAEEGFGPVEEAFTVAPREALEVVYELVRRQIHEEVVEVGSETVSETAVETKNLDEVSDKVASMTQRDNSMAMSASASYGSIGVWQASANATSSLKASAQRSREETSRKLKEVTTRASERITKTFSIKTRDIEDVTATNLTRRIIKNESAEPVSYGLRRVLRRVQVKVQDLGPRLVWQLYLHNPGEGLAQSRFVHFLESQPIAPPHVPPSVRPQPTGGTETGTTSSMLAWDASRGTWYAELSIQVGTDKQVTGISVDSITDLEGGGKNDLAPSPRNDIQYEGSMDVASHKYTSKVAVLAGDASSVSISYTYSWEPSQEVMDAWDADRRKAEAEAATAEAKEKAQALQDDFDRKKQLITERSKIRPRPANDLRREERYEVMNRLISQLFAHGNNPSEPMPLEIEYFNRFFDIDGMFTYTHPSWWKPRYTPIASSFKRPEYEITSESEPAPMGRSLGWLIQLDGDTRRNEFLNSPWIRVCLPMRPNRERAAIAWLAKYIEGEHGYDPKNEPLKGLLTDIEKIHANQDALGINGPEYVTVDSTVGAPGEALTPENVYPIIDDFEVTVPTDGFVYDELKMVM